MWIVGLDDGESGVRRERPLKTTTISVSGSYPSQYLRIIKFIYRREYRAYTSTRRRRRRRRRRRQRATRPMWSDHPRLCRPGEI